DEMQRVLDTTKGFIAWLNRRIVAALGGTRVLQEQLIAKIEASTTPTLRHYGRKVEAANLRQMLSLDPAAIYAQVRVPVLIVSGGKDVQCPPGDGTRSADIVPGPSELDLIGDLTPLLRRSDTAAGFRGYAA